MDINVFNPPVAAPVTSNSTRMQPPAQEEKIRLQGPNWPGMGSDNRVMIGFQDYQTVSCFRSGLFELLPDNPSGGPGPDLLAAVDNIRKRVPTLGTKCDPDEVRTIPVVGFFRFGDQTGLLYNCLSQPVSLGAYLATNPKPSRAHRLRIIRGIATAARSVAVHFDNLRHPGLRGDSFVYRPVDKTRKDTIDPVHPELDMEWPFLLDWARPSQLDMYQHPCYRTDKPKLQWTYQAFSLLMIFGQIANWQPLAEAPDAATLLTMKESLVKALKDTIWDVFRWAFDVLNQDSHRLEQFSSSDIKQFYDIMCQKINELLVKEMRKDLGS